jgi:hypothetical protein
VSVASDGTPASFVGREYYGHDQVLHLRLGDGSMIRARMSAHEPITATDTLMIRLRRDPVVLPATGA